MTSVPTPDRIATLIDEVAAEVIMPRHKSLAAGEVREKTGPKDLVTIADEEAEALLTPALMGMLPGSRVLGEEAASADPSLFDALRGEAPVWIVDPVDGTRNFANGGRYFCVMVALVVGGEAVLGVIHDPLGKCWAGGEKGGGAWKHGPDGALRRLSVLPPKETNAMRGALNFRFLPSPLREETRARSDDVVDEHYRLGCAGHEYLRLLTGEAHFSMYVKCMPWDHVPGTMLHREAGGHQARLDGRSYLAHELTGGLMSAPDATSWQQLREGLYPKDLPELG